MNELKVETRNHTSEAHLLTHEIERRDACFIGGSVRLASAGAVDYVQGAEVTLSKKGKRLATATSNGLGHLAFNGFPGDGSTYRLEISHPNGSVRRDCVLSQSIHLVFALPSSKHR